MEAPFDGLLLMYHACVISFLNHLMLVLLNLFTHRKGLCNNYQDGGGGAEKLELSSKNLDSTPPPKQRKLVLTPLCYVKNNFAPPPPTQPLL